MAFTVKDIVEAFELLFSSLHRKEFTKTLQLNEWGEQELLPRLFGQAETKNQVFVAMSFEQRFNDRFDSIIKPAIEDELIAGVQLTAFKVNNSLTGDSILTDIADGIVHSAIFLADVSVIDEGRYAETPIRNGNVMYEVGLALASRQPSEVLLVRDDTKKFLFDVSTIPHITIDFTKQSAAIQRCAGDYPGTRLVFANMVHAGKEPGSEKKLTVES